MVNQRSNWIDYAKAIGIVLVVFGHAVRGLEAANIATQSAVFKLIDSVIYSFHMPLFFFISGFLFLESMKKRGPYFFMLTKLDTVVYPYIVWGLAQGVLMAILASHGFANNHITLTQVFTIWKPLGQFWFLYDLFFVFLIASFLYTKTKQKYFNIILILSGIAYVYQVWVISHSTIGFLARDFVFFAFGILISLKSKEINFRVNYLVYFALFLFVIAQYYFHIILGYTWLNKGIYSLVLALVSITFVFALSMRLSTVANKYVLYIGQNSMAIYLMHVILAAGTRVALQKLFGLHDFYLHLLFGTLVGVAGSLVLVKMFDYYRIRYIFAAPISKLFIHKPHSG